MTPVGANLWIDSAKALWTLTGGAAALLSLPGTIELSLLTAAGALPFRSFGNRLAPENVPWRVAVIVPAHDEASCIRDCVDSLQSADRNGTDLTIVVVADNCADNTAALARESGAIVLERHDPALRGKGYALHFAFSALMNQGFDAFLIVDADTSVATNFLSEMSRVLRAGADAVQCRYLVRNSSATARTRLMAVAMRAYNVLRPRARHRLGLSCNLYGNGFGMRSATLNTVPYLAGSVVEDVEYHLMLIRAGYRVVFVNETEVCGEMPVAGKGITTQRARWEGGRLHMLRLRAPGLLLDVMKGRLRSLEPLLDLLLLPLAFHVTLLLLSTLNPLPAVRTVGGAGLLVLVLHLIAAIQLCGGGWRDYAVLLASPFYVAWKVLLTPMVLSNARADAKWVRTERPAEKRPL